MWFTIEVVLGALLGAAFVALARALGRLERTLLAAGLVVAALVYVGMGLTAHPPSELWIEGVGAGAFLVLAVAGYLGSPLLLAAGWAAHGAWDLVVPLFTDVAYLSEWYIAACLGFDLALAAYIAGVGCIPSAGRKHGEAT
ncbi:MAG: hypothetical protein JSU66_11790 [Deltaproteobacteria bacterium]|nr:MAG: hypothetical protein JSU66_11790 [Deltaproteobacteria bacterium]